METTNATVTRRVPFNPVFRAANRSRARYRVLMGGAGSGKSRNLAQDYVLKLSDTRYRGANLLVCRRVDETHRYSTFSELCAAVQNIFGEDWPMYWKISQSPLRLKCLATGNEIVFRGMIDLNAQERVKSLSFPEGKLCWIWCEEATELTRENLELLDDRLRGQLANPALYYQITLSFNPVSAHHWIKRRFFDEPQENAIVCHSTFRDNRFIDPGFAVRMEERRERDPEGYRVYGAGQEDVVSACLCGASAGGLELAQGSLPRAKTLFGMSRDYLHQAAVTAGGKLYIENGVANIVSASFGSGALCADLRPDTGLVGTPEQTDYGVSAKCLLNPCLKLNARVRIDSEYVVPQEARKGTQLSALPTDGVYRISRISYLGDTRGEDWYCEIEAENAAAVESRDDEPGDKIHCALPGIIEAFDEAEQTVSVRLAVREKVRDETGEGYTEKEIPVLQNVPVFFPRAGGWSLLFPIAKGDECLVIFCDRCIDGWWQNGGVQSQAESRSHDYSDGIALIGPWSQPRRIQAKWPKNGARLTKDTGGCYIEVGGGTVTIAGDCVITGSLTAGRGGSDGKSGSEHKFYGDVFTAQTKETKLQSETGVEMQTAAFTINEQEFQDHTHTGANAPVEKWY